jgi:hypothetical protein
MATTISASPGDGVVGKILKTADSSGVLTLQTMATDALTVGTDKNVVCNGFTALNVPVGTTAQRPSSPINGMLRYNTTIPQLEVYINGWIALP